jgi:hypothetical protein
MVCKVAEAVFWLDPQSVSFSTSLLEEVSRDLFYLLQIEN